MYKDEKGHERYEISESLDLMNRELEKDKDLLTIVSKAYCSKSKKEVQNARTVIMADKVMQDWLITYSMGVLFRNISDYMVYYFCGCPSNFSDYSASEWAKSEQFMIDSDVTFVHKSFDKMRKISNEMCHIYTQTPKDYLVDMVPPLMIKHNLMSFYYYDWEKTMNFKGIIEVMAKKMLESPTSSMGIHNHHYFILLKNELELLAEIAAEKSKMSIVEYLFDRPNKIYTVSLLLGLLSRRVLEGKLTIKIVELTTDPDLLKNRCDWDIPNKIGFLRQLKYHKLAESYTYVNNESKLTVHPLIGKDDKNMSPEVYFANYKPRLKKTIELLDDEAPQKGYIMFWLCALAYNYGLHKFYLGEWKWGIAYLLTGGFFGFGEIYDYIMLVTGKATNANGQPLRDNTFFKSKLLFKVFVWVIIVISIYSRMKQIISGEFFDAFFIH